MLNSVYEGDGEQCGDSPLTVASSDTYLANIVTRNSGRGSRSCPWLIRVSHGQTVNLTLFDYAVLEDKPVTQQSAEGQFDTCQIYVQMYIGDTSTVPTTVCSLGVRQRVIYSHTGKQDIRIVIGRNSGQQDYYFLLHVEGTHFAFSLSSCMLLPLRPVQGRLFVCSFIQKITQNRMTHSV